MDESLITASPPSKRLRSEISSSDEESDLPKAIFPSKDFNTSLESCEFFYPSEESNLEPLKATEFTQNRHSKQQNSDNYDSEDHELEKIGRLLVGTCCDKLCLCHYFNQG